MRHTSDHQKQRGYTLIELLLYVSIVGVMLVAITMFFGSITDSRVKGQSINEVESQGLALMDYLTQTVRNASSITAPTSGASATSLTLAVPTASLSPTVFDGNATALGYSTVGGTIDTSNQNTYEAVKFTAGATGTINTVYAYVSANLGASPNNKGQAAIYSDNAGSPQTRLGYSTADTTLTASSWNAFPITSTDVTSGSVYWLVYNTNGTTINQNNLVYDTGSTNQTRWSTINSTYGTWQPTWPGNSGASNTQFSMYAPIETSTAAALRVKEGAGSAMPLSSTDVQVTGLSFKNLTRSGTNGLVQISFTVAHFNPNNQNEYDYRKTFTSTAEVGW
ncbi:MAG TPA: type II secretion system protein [Candidatus Saccharimonadales bacterium]